MHQIACIYIAVPQQKWNNTYLEITYKLEGENIANFCFQDKRVEIFCWFKRVRDFAPYGWTSITQRHLTCVGFAEGALQNNRIRVGVKNLFFR